MSRDEWIRYCTQAFLSYMNEPKDERLVKRKLKKTERPSFLNRWFGILPWALSQLFRKKKSS